MSKQKHSRRTVKILNSPPGQSDYTNFTTALRHVAERRALWVGDHQTAIELLEDAWLAAVTIATAQDIQEQALDAQIEGGPGHIRWTGKERHVNRVLVPPGIYRS